MLKWKTLSHLSKRKLEKIQNKQLRYFIQHKIPLSPYYNKLLEKLGMETELKEKRIVDKMAKI